MNFRFRTSFTGDPVDQEKREGQGKKLTSIMEVPLGQNDS
jgi:hypothetical protein